MSSERRMRLGRVEIVVNGPTKINVWLHVSATSGPDKGAQVLQCTLEELAALKWLLDAMLPVESLAS